MDNINKDKALIGARILTMIENGRTEVTTIKQLKKFPIGSLVSYINSSGIFNIGGFLLAIFDDSFSFVDLDFKIRYRVAINKIDKIWIGSVFKVRNDYVSICPSDKKATNFPAIIANIVIFYAPDNYALKRFISTQKYKLAVLWAQRFHISTINKHLQSNA